MFGYRSLKQEVALNREVTERLFADLHQFMREERLRANKVFDRMIERFDRMDASHDELIASHRKLIASHDELVADSRAQREGFLALIDELRRGGGRPGDAAA